MEQTDVVAGRCLCGKVAFELRGTLGPVTHCHCRSCRLSRGAAFVTWTSVPPDRFHVTSGDREIAWYRTSPGIRWGFCRNCGSQMFYIADSPGHPDGPQPGYVYASVGSLTEDGNIEPSAHVSYEEHVRWVEGQERLPRYRAKTGERMD